MNAATFTDGIASGTRYLPLALVITCSGCWHSGLDSRSPDPCRNATPPSAPAPSASNGVKIPSHTQRTGLSFFFTPATFADGRMETSVRIYNDGEVPILIQSIEVIEVNAELGRTGPLSAFGHTSGQMHAKADHGTSRIPMNDADVWSFSLPFPCAPFLRLTLRTTAMNEVSGGTEVITFVSGVEAYEGCPAGWEKSW